MALKCTGVGDSYRLRLRRQIPHPECRVELIVGSMKAQHRRMHGTDPSIDWSRIPASQTVHQPQAYDARCPQETKQRPCPLPGRLGSSHM